MTEEEGGGRRNRSGGTIIVDASVSKTLPDSFSRTLPVWCTVINRVTSYYRRQFSNKKNECESKDNLWWDNGLYTPSSIVSQEERLEICNVLDGHVRSVLDSGVILDPNFLVNILQKPLRCWWISNCHHLQNMENSRNQCNYTSLQEQCERIIQEAQNYTCILCVSCSGSPVCFPHNCDNPCPTHINVGTEYSYVPGAGDDEESWSRGLTPSLFWQHHREILDNVITADQTNISIDKIVGRERKLKEQSIEGAVGEDAYLSCTGIGLTGISIGSRISGKPSMCWKHFDCIINVTTNEYDGMSSSVQSFCNIPRGKYYIQMPVKEGKKDRSELEKYMPVAMIFIFEHCIIRKRKLLVHCAQGRDRSVAVVLSALCIFFDFDSLTQVDNNVADAHHGYKVLLRPRDWYHGLFLSNFENFWIASYFNKTTFKREAYDTAEYFRRSGLNHIIWNALIERNGRDLLFSWIQFEMYKKTLLHFDSLEIDSKSHNCKYIGFGRIDHFKSLATKNEIRLALHYIQQYRNIAHPTRKTMQKLNRFFMSGNHELFKSFH
mmetsp:Transcript_21254/g.29794  ORF Transcript_21254/g.29794 Transcript_21254/m.29794 type:complete len:549 (-) Transcript_21254:124-1770(-)